MKIVSWNVNSVRAREENILDYIKKNNPDYLLLQEIKTLEENFPIDSFEKLGYRSFIHGQKSYNGVAILSKNKAIKIEKDFIKDPKKQSRIIKAEINYQNKKIILINIYVPNGNPVDTDKYEYKKKWLDKLINQLKDELKKNLEIILTGDFNIIPDKKDVHDYKKFENDALFKLEIRKKFREILSLGFADVYRFFNKDKQEYTFWDYMAGSWYKNNGMRIDHFLVTTRLLKKLKSTKINKEPRGRVKPSDHTPIELIII